MLDFSPNARCTVQITSFRCISHLGLSLEAQATAMGLVVELVVRVHDPPQIDATNLLCAALVLQVVQQPVNDATNSPLVFQIVNILWRKGDRGERSGDSF